MAMSRFSCWTRDKMAWVQGHILEPVHLPLAASQVCGPRTSELLEERVKMLIPGHCPRLLTESQGRGQWSAFWTCSQVFLMHLPLESPCQALCMTGHQEEGWFVNGGSQSQQTAVHRQQPLSRIKAAPALVFTTCTYSQSLCIYLSISPLPEQLCSFLVYFLIFLMIFFFFCIVEITLYLWLAMLFWGLAYFFTQHSISIFPCYQRVFVSIMCYNHMT